MSFLYFGIGSTTKIFAPLISIFSFTALVKNYIIKYSIDRKFNYVIFLVLFISSIIYAVFLFQLDFLNIGTMTPNGVPTFYGFCKDLSIFILILQPLFIGYEIYQLLSNIIIGESDSPLIIESMKRIIKKLILPIGNLMLLSYWHYILK